MQTQVKLNSVDLNKHAVFGMWICGICDPFPHVSADQKRHEKADSLLSLENPLVYSFTITISCCQLEEKKQYWQVKEFPRGFVAPNTPAISIEMWWAGYACKVALCLKSSFHIFPIEKQRGYIIFLAHWQI